MDLLIITHFLNGFFMIALPIILGILLISKFHSSGKFWLVGAAIFIIAQVFHIPFNLLILNPWLGKIQNNLSGVPGSLIVAMLLGLSAGIFESFARYAMYRWWLKDNRSWQMGVLAGAGHGGIEAIILGALVLLTYINMVAYRNFDLSSLNLIPEQLSIARQQIQNYWSLPWYDTMLGAVERIFTIPFHIAASVLVLQCFTRKTGQQKLIWLGAAILLHTILDASAVFIAKQWGIYTTEMVLGVLAVLDIFIIFALRQPEPLSVTPPPLPIINEPPAYTTTPIEETTENLDKTRYQSR